MTVGTSPVAAIVAVSGTTATTNVALRFEAGADLVVHTRVTGGSWVLRTLGVDYTVSGGQTDAGGTITWTPALAITGHVRYRRRTSKAQGARWKDSERFPALAVERALDRLTLSTQEATDMGDRAITVPLGEAGIEVGTAAQRASKFFTFDDDGAPLFIGFQEAQATQTMTLIAAFLSAGPNVEVTFDAGTNTITIGTTGLALSGHGHGNASGGAAGFMSAADKTKLDQLISNDNPAALGGGAGPGTSPKAARLDHIHPFPTATNVGADAAGTAANAISTHVGESDPHGQYALESAVASALAGKSDTSHGHTNASTSVAGFLSAADKTKLDSIPTGGLTPGFATQPGAPLAASGAVGVVNLAAHEDHTHPFPSAADVGAAAAVHTHAVANVTGLQTQLDLKLPIATIQKSPVLSPMFWGAVGDDTANDRSVIDALMAAAVGADVDLGGRQYYLGASGAVPDQCRWFGGSVRIGSTVTKFPPARTWHPVDGELTIVDDWTDTHWWPGPIGRPANDDVLLRARAMGWRHNVNDEAPLILDRSEGCTDLFENARTWSRAGIEPRFLIGGMITANRFVVGFQEVGPLPGAAITRSTLLYSDDGFTTAPVEVDIGTVLLNFHGEPVRAADGDLMLYGHGAAGIYGVASNNNCAAGGFSTSLLKAGAGSISLPVEPIVLRLAAAFYVMFVRDGDGTPGNAWWTWSVDGKSWPNAWAECTGLGLASNPVTGKVQGGAAFLYLAARRSTPIAGYEDKLLVARWSVTALAAAAVAGTAPPVVPLQVACTLATAGIAYLTFADLPDGGCIGHLIDGETVLGSDVPTSTRTLLIGGPKIAKPGSYALARAVADAPLNGNCNHKFWPRKTTWAAGTYNNLDIGWAFGVVGTTYQAEQATLDPEVRLIVEDASEFGLRIWSAGGGTQAYLRALIPGREAMMNLSQTEHAFWHALMGDWDGITGRAVAFFGTGGSTTVVNAMTPAQTVLSDGVTIIEGVLTIPDMTGKTWGAGAKLFLELYSASANAFDFIHIVGAMRKGKVPAPPRTQNSEIQLAALDRKVHRRTWRNGSFVAQVKAVSTSTFEGILDFATTMAALPNATLAPSSSAADFKIGATACTAIDVDGESLDCGRIFGTLASATLVADTWYHLVANADTAAIVVDGGS